MTTSVFDTEGFADIVACILDDTASLSPYAVIWDTDSDPFISDRDRARVVLDIFSISALAVDEHRRAFEPDGYPATSFVTQEIGNRTIVLTVRAEAFDKRVQAAELIDMIRTGIRAEKVTAQLNAINLAYVWSEQATRVKYKVDQRVVNAAVADFTFAGIAQQISSVEINEGWISTVDGNNIVPGTLTP